MARVLVGGNILETVIVCIDNEQASYNVFHHLVATGGTITATDADVAKALSNGLATPYKNAMTSSSAFRGAQTRVLIVTPPPSPQAFVGDAGDGAIVGIPLPRQCTGIISWRTAGSGPGMRGRSYIPFPPVEADEGDGVPTDAYLTLLGLIAGAFLSVRDIEVSGRVAHIDPGILHRSDLSFTPFTDFRTPRKFATQRRRGSYGRPNSTPF